MDDLISRQAAIQALYDGAYLSFEKRNELIDRMNRIPTAETRKGKWLDYCGDLKCNQCGCEADLFGIRGEWNYCPNCGARMEE